MLFFFSVLFCMSFHKISIFVTGRANCFAIDKGSLFQLQITQQLLNKTNAFLCYTGIYFFGTKNASRSDLGKRFSRFFQMDKGEIKCELTNLNYLPGLMIQSSQSNANVLWLPSAIISSMSIKIGKIILHIIDALECRLALDCSHN